MTRFSLGGDHDCEGPSNFPPKRRRVAEEGAESGGGGGGEEDVAVGEEEGDGGEGDYEEETPEENSCTESFSGRDGTLEVTLTDSDVLDCPLCLEPLKAPVFQCENGHIACSSCCGKIKNTCSLCTLPIGYIRCRVIEKVLESARLKCRNVNRGCKRLCCYHEKGDHESNCPFSPRPCPFPNCSYIGSSKQLSGHFTEMHAAYRKFFLFNICQTMQLPLTSKVYVLQERKEGVLYVLRNDEHRLGNVMRIDCFAPPTDQLYMYELVVKAKGSSLKLQTNLMSEALVNGNYQVPFLLLPRQLCKIGGEVNFCIRTSD